MQLYIEDFGKLRDGYERLIKLENMIYPDAITYLKEQRNKEKVISKDFINLYAQYDRIEWEKHQNGDISFKTDKKIESIAKTLHEKWILKTQSLIHKILSYNSAYDKKRGFVDYMRFLKENSDPNILIGDNIDEAPDNFYYAFTYDGSDTYKESYKRFHKVSEYSGNSFLEIRFVYALVGLNESNTHTEAIGILESIKDIYPVAKDLLSKRSLPNITRQEGTVFAKLLDGATDRQAINDALKIYCRKMIYYKS